MDLLKSDTLPGLLVLLAPGFFAVKVFDLLVPSERRDWSKEILQVLSYGMLNLALWSPFIDLIFAAKSSEPWVYGLGSITVLFVSPAMLAVGWNALLRWPFLHRWLIDPTPTAWDAFFRRRQACWMLFHLKDGRKAGGLFRESSKVSMYPYPRDVYVEEVWQVDTKGRFQKKIPGSAGMLISAENCQLIELFRLTQEEPANVSTANQAAGAPAQLASGENLRSKAE